MIIIFLGFINTVIKIKLIPIGITWHTSYTTFFEDSIYSFFQIRLFKVIRCRYLFKSQVQFLNNNKNPIQTEINVIARKILLTHSNEHLFA